MTVRRAIEGDVKHLRAWDETAMLGDKSSAQVRLHVSTSISPNVFVLLLSLRSCSMWLSTHSIVPWPSALETSSADQGPDSRHEVDQAQGVCATPC